MSVAQQPATIGESLVPAGITRAMEPVATALELFGVAVIVIAVMLATVRFVTDWRGRDRHDAYQNYRAGLGRGILLGLELLVGADIIATVTAPLSWESVSLLGLIVLIRTFLSFSLETEIEGRLPWRNADKRGPDA
jgi:uncharacterized membrane protein